jgi:hypothetical protein
MIGMKPMNILEEAQEATSGERPDSYGHPKVAFSRTAALWSAYLGIEIKSEQIPMMMILLKVGRDLHKPKRDNLVDIAGYARARERMNEQ